MEIKLGKTIVDEDVLDNLVLSDVQENRLEILLPYQSADGYSIESNVYYGKKLPKSIKKIIKFFNRNEDEFNRTIADYKTFEELNNEINNLVNPSNNNKENLIYSKYKYAVINRWWEI
jgi:hypothetical protein